MSECCLVVSNWVGSDDVHDLHNEESWRRTRFCIHSFGLGQQKISSGRSEVLSTANRRILQSICFVSPNGYHQRAMQSGSQFEKN